MSDTILQQLEQELEATQQRCHTIERAIAALREIYPSNGHKVRRGKVVQVVKRRTNERTNERTNARRTPAQRSLPDSATRRNDVTETRDLLIKQRLRKGPAPFAELKAALPDEPGMNDEQKTRACSNALTRLRLKKDIKSTDEGWALA